MRGLLTDLRPLGFSLDDFTTNGILLPALPSLSRQTGMPLHMGSHALYNAQVMEKLDGIRAGCDVIDPGVRHRVILRLFRRLQRQVRATILALGPQHIDSILLSGSSDPDIDAMIDMLYAARPLIVDRRSHRTLQTQKKMRPLGSHFQSVTRRSSRRASDPEVQKSISIGIDGLSLGGAWPNEGFQNDAHHHVVSPLHECTKG